MGRCRSIGANHRICQFSGGSCHRIQKGRSGFWDWLQNFYHCGSGNSLWNLYKLATWGHILDISADSEVDGKGVSHSRKSDTAVKQSCGSDPSRAQRQIGQNHCETREFCPKGEEKRDFTKEEEPCSVVDWAKSL